MSKDIKYYDISNDLKVSIISDYEYDFETFQTYIWTVIEYNNELTLWKIELKENNE